MANYGSKNFERMTNYLSILILLLTLSCTEKIEIAGFDKEKWANDVGGCKHERKALVDLLMNNKEQLLGKDQAQIKALLGKPGMHEIYRRAQRFYIYSIAPSPSCPTYMDNKNLANLTLRFNALGRVHEVVYYK